MTTRVFWFNHGEHREDVPDSEAHSRMQCYRTMGFETWCQRLKPAPRNDWPGDGQAAA